MRKSRSKEVSEVDVPTLAMSRFNPIASDDSPLLFHELRGARQIDSPHKHDFFIMLLVERGTGIHRVDFIDYPLQPYQLHLVFPHQVHQWDFSDDTVVYQLMLSPHLFQQVSPWYRLPVLQQQAAVLNLPTDIWQTLLHEFLCIKAELVLKPTYWELLYLRCQVIGLLVSKLLLGEAEKHDQPSVHPLLTKFVQLIESHYRTARAVSYYADKLHISANYLNVLCKKHSKVPASKIIQDRILLEAKRLLKVSDRSAKEIAYELGFYDHASFSKFFKSQTGYSPTAFKKQP